MPSNPTRQTIARQWQLLKLLPHRHPGLSTSQLQFALSEAGHKASKRTVERDLNELVVLFPLQCNSKGVPYGWYWQPGLSLGEAYRLLPGDFASAQPIALQAWVDQGLALHLAEQPLSDDMRLESLAEGGARLEATVDDNRALMGWLLSHAGSIRLQAPEGLREAMLMQLRQSLALHEAKAAGSSDECTLTH
ncbi:MULTISPECIES: WYL domain-containing protein [Pseudomonas]|uniref:DNA-binding transcriptional regulator YafY n=1 Tax=Pseudomonas hunanensis TaxID=1247546 RepID=A0ACC6JYF6_9PSED|nr:MULTISPECIES: WYL domain-containing protein [Pseudomonas]MBP2263040.1 putative DNA-binding transcriptional regulator YafY [Pseudomonas sp. BP8]MDR6711225.1 putative DNA-binding transcriptional regulator YafY [Pseudomonas hunanensis]HDS1738026.1 WYL domain-containing protein [Pseudomonas putida]